MTQKELTMRNVGQSLDDLMNLDPRGYGVCKILYPAAREYAGGPVCMRAARLLDESVKTGTLVYILTGFVLLPHKKPETDGICGALQMARAVVEAYGAVPVLVVPEDSVRAAFAMAPVVGLHAYASIEEARELPFSVAVVTFTKDRAQAPVQAERMLSLGLPSMAISTEAPGANAVGEYHNAAGQGITALEAKSDVLWDLLRARGVPTLAVGDLGNEIGMGSLGAHIRQYVPRAAENTCVCGCGGGLLAVSEADAVVTATVSDWGIYAVCAALAYLHGDMGISPEGSMVRECITAASRAGMVDMTGRLTPGVDGFDVEFNTLLATMMRRTAEYPEKLAAGCGRWFDETDALGFFEKD
ncbi:MAG: DUF4392 domain-containing protein [Eubacteriales bacterium]|nr:DUF4392 domain-containing protein [Eubacteriales bacterium]MDY3286607.1 DUF4392 domain-containing protein [Eubacteriales bacterium]